jgi:hypothetical protein
VGFPEYLDRVSAGVDRFVRDYMSRHRNPWSRALHLVGVPTAPIYSTYLLVRGRFRKAGKAFVVGYSLQWLGHRIEGNELGEWILVKKLAARLSGRRS